MEPDVDAVLKHSVTDDRDKVPAASASETTQVPELFPKNREGGASNQLATTDPSLVREAILRQETLWSRLLDLRKLEASFDNQQAIKGIYAELAAGYAGLGGADQAARLLKKALENGDDELLRRQLANMQGFQAGKDFILTFESLLATSVYDLKLALEYCYWLETRELHEAALNVLLREVKKRSPSANAGEGEILSSFLALLHALSSVDRQLNIQDYKELIRTHFPDAVVQNVQQENLSNASTVVGEELEEYDAGLGLADEATYLIKLLLFYTRHYVVAVIIGSICVIAILLTMFRFSERVTQSVGSAGVYTLLVLLCYQFLRSFRFVGTQRTRAQSKVTRNALFATLSLVLVTYLAPRILRQEIFSPLAQTLLGMTGCMALLWQTYISVGALKSFLTDLRHEVVDKLERRAFRRTIASMVKNLSQWTFIVGMSFGWAVIAFGRLPVALFAACQLLYLLLGWRWGHLESRAEKQKARDAYAFLMALIFVGQVATGIWLGLTVYSAQHQWPRPSRGDNNLRTAGDTAERDVCGDGTNVVHSPELLTIH